MVYYLNNTDLLYEVKLSTGKGFSTPKLQGYILLLSEQISHKFLSRTPNKDDFNDAHNRAIESLLINWKSFNSEKYDNAIAYFTEIYKRGFITGLNEIKGIKYNVENPKFISIEHSMSNREER